jgi:hypothetical protein
MAEFYIRELPCFDDLGNKVEEARPFLFFKHEGVDDLADEGHKKLFLKAFEGFLEGVDLRAADAVGLKSVAEAAKAAKAAREEREKKSKDVVPVRAAPSEVKEQEND